jgi:hypothetical protein
LRSGRSAKAGTGFSSDRTLTYKVAHDLVGKPASTSADQALCAGATLGDGFLLLALAATLRIQRQAERQSFLPNRTFSALEQLGDLTRRNDVLGSGLQRFHFCSEPSTPFLFGSQLNLLKY